MEHFSQEHPQPIPLPMDISSLVSFASAVAPSGKLTESSVLGVNKHMLFDLLEDKQAEDRKKRLGFDANAMGLVPMAFVSVMIGMLIDAEMIDLDFLLDGSHSDFNSDFF
jgi:hypothetical protein